MTISTFRPGLEIENTSRRDFLKGGVGLTLAITLPGLPAVAEAAREVAPPFVANAFVSIGVDNTVTVAAKHLEMGQGTYTGLATLVAEELGAAWAQIKVEGAPADAKRYANLAWGTAQGTGGSSAMANSFEQMRKAGATARAMLVSAAGKKWGVPAATLEVKNGVVRHPDSGRNASFGELAALAAQEPVPAEVTLKDPAKFEFIGREVRRKDSQAKSTGMAMFTIDVRLPDMLTAVVAHPPRFGGKPGKVDDSAARKVPGVVDVHIVPTGVAVVGRDFWSAKRGRDALRIEWDESAAFRGNSPQLFAEYRELAAKPGLRARRDGDPEAALAGAAKKLEAIYEFPYLAHAAMEPMDCVVRVAPGRCEVWNGEQMQTADQFALAKLFGIAPEAVSINMLFAGGSFGRRANPLSDYLLEAGSIAKAQAARNGGKATVKMIWTREDDTQAGFYRPMYVHRLAGGLDAEGRISAWQERIVGQSIVTGTPFESWLVKDGIDATSVEGASTLPYAIPNLGVELHTTRNPVPVQWWRSVGSTHTAYATEVFFDELAAAAGKDPVALRLELLDKHPRHAGVLKLAAGKAGWGQPLAPGKPGERRGRGVAVHESFHSFVAQVAEVTVKPDGQFHVDRVVCAVDCGIAINPDVVRAQMEGGIGYGLSAALMGEITLKDGRVEQSNFDGYRVLRIGDMPRVEVFIVPSAAPPTGVGEPGTPPVAPAVANALFAATGVRLRRLPFASEALKVKA